MTNAMQVIGSGISAGSRTDTRWLYLHLGSSVLSKISASKQKQGRTRWQRCWFEASRVPQDTAKRQIRERGAAAAAGHRC